MARPNINEAETPEVLASVGPNGSRRVTQADGSNKSKKGLLWFLLGLLVLLCLLAALLSFLHNRNQTSSNDNVGTVRSNTDNTSSIKSNYDRTVAMTDRTFYFNPDVVDEQNPAQVDNGVTKIAAFYKANKGTKLDVNGSVFDGQTGNAGNPLAMQRATLIKQKLVSAGVDANDIQATAVNTYTGQTDAAKAEYARSVTVEAK